MGLDNINGYPEINIRDFMLTIKDKDLDKCNGKMDLNI